MYSSENWVDYSLIDCGGGQRLERWGNHVLIRPDPQAIWEKEDHALWKKADATYHRSKEGGGRWDVKRLPQDWQINYRNLTFNIKPMNFKHTGVFPEQAANWDFIMDAIPRAQRRIRVLNLFAYTGAATMAAACAGAEVCHVDAAKGMVQWAKENAKSSNLADAPIRYIIDDCVKFIQREIKRESRYDAIIMDPPSYGRGPSNEIWKFEDNIASLISLCRKVLTNKPLFFIINSYTSGISPSVPAYMLGREILKDFGGRVEAAELGLKVETTGLMLPCGHTSRYISPQLLP